MTLSLPADFDTELARLYAGGEFHRVLRRFEMGGPPEETSPRARVLVATAAARVGDFDRGERLAQSALDAYAAQGDDAGELRACNVLGGIAFERGNLDAAEGYFRRVAQRGEALGDQEACARGLNNLASIRNMRDQAGDAISWWYRALEVYLSAGDPLGAARVHHNLALALRERGYLDAAETHAHEAILLASRSDDPPLEAMTRMGRVELSLARGRPQSARFDLVAAEQAARRAGDQSGLVEVCRLRALIALAEDAPEEALMLATQAHDMATDLGVTLLAAECRALLAITLHRLGRTEEAEAAHRTALDCFERQRAPADRRRVERAWEMAVSR